MSDAPAPDHPEAGLPARPAGHDDVASRTGIPSALADVAGADTRSPGDIDLRAYWHVVLKRRWLIAAVIGSVVLVTLMLTLMATPVYRATTVMQIDNEEQHVVQVGGVATQTGYDPDFLETQYQLLQSRALAERVAAALRLDQGQLEALSRDDWLAPLRASQGRARKRASSDAPEAQLAAKTELVRQGLVIEPVRNSRLVKIDFDSADPQFSAQVANALAEAFIASGLERRFGASSYAKKYLEGQLKSVKAKLEDSERQLVAFAQRENLVSGTDGQSLAGQNLADLNARLATAQEQRIRAQARWTEVQVTSGAALPSDMLGNSIIRTLQQQRAQLQGQYQQKLEVFKPDYPEMQQLQGQIDAVDQQIATELRNIRGSVRAEYDAAAGQERLLQHQLAGLRADALDVDSRSIDYNIIKREVDTNRQLYDGLLQRYKEVGVAGDVRSNNISIIDRAEVPTQRFKPRLPLNLAVGLLFGLLIAGVATAALEYVDDSLKTPDDIEQRLHLAVLGIIPKLLRETPGEAFADPRSAFSESYRSLRTALQFSTSNGVPRSLLITSAVSGEGKTTSALTLARNLAELGRRVLLIEGDLRNPSLARLLAKSGQKGLSSFLAGAAPLSEVIQDTQDDRLKVIVAGPLPPNPAELLAGDRLAELLHAAGTRFDHIVIDGPPVMGIADAPILGNAVEGTIMVVHSARTRIATAQAAVKRLRAARTQIIGCLLTQYDAKAAGYGYEYEGYYAYGVVPHKHER